MYVDVAVPPAGTFPDHTAWLRARAGLAGVGASEAGLLYGLGGTPRALWERKVTRSVDPRVTGDGGDMGHRLEPVIIALFADTHPEYEILPSPGTLRHPRLGDLLTATPDALLRHRETGWETGLECKAPGAHKAREWRSDVEPGVGGLLPDRYWAQVQASMAVTGTDAWWVRALIGGQRHAELLVPRDDGFITRLEWDLPAWWEEHVVAVVPPEGDPLPAEGVGLTVPDPAPLRPGQDAEVEKLHRIWREATDRAAAAKADADAASAAARAILGDYEVLAVGDVVHATARARRGPIRKGIRDAALAEFTGDEFRDPPTRPLLWK